jgi:group I intron endonuclease
MIVYKITNSINKKVYIGQTVRPIKERWREHIIEKRSVIGNAIKKYGKEKFTIEEISGANNITELNYQEWLLIHKNNTLTPNGYNLKEGGKNGFFSKETKEKMSKARKGVTFSEEHKKKLSINKKKYWDSKCSLDNKKIISNTFKDMWVKRKTSNWINPQKDKKRPNMMGKNNPMYGKNPEDYMTKEVIEQKRKKISTAIKGKKQSNEWIKKRIDKTKKKVKCLETGCIFDSITAAAKSSGCSISFLSQVLSKKYPNKTAKGLSYIYI